MSFKGFFSKISVGSVADCIHLCKRSNVDILIKSLNAGVFCYKRNERLRMGTVLALMFGLIIDVKKV